MEKNLSTDYLKSQGDLEFTKAALKLAYGEKNGVFGEKYDISEIVQAQAVSGTGALFLMLETLKKFYKPLTETKEFWIPNPSWANHANMIGHLGLTTKYYRYYDLEKRVFTADLMLEDLNKIP